MQEVPLGGRWGDVLFCVMEDRTIDGVEIERAVWGVEEDNSGITVDQRKS